MWVITVESCKVLMVKTLKGQILLKHHKSWKGKVAQLKNICKNPSTWELLHRITEYTWKNNIGSKSWLIEKLPRWSKIAVLRQKKNLIKLEYKTCPLNPTKLALQIKTDWEKGSLQTKNCTKRSVAVAQNVASKDLYNWLQLTCRGRKEIISTTYFQDKRKIIWTSKEWEASCTRN